MSNDPTEIASALLASPYILALLVGVGLVLLAKGFNEVQKLWRNNQPRPANDEISSIVTRQGMQLDECSRRICEIQADEAACKKYQGQEREKLYNLARAAAQSAGEANTKLDLLIRLTRENKRPT
jgi:hypothetical protein